MADVSDRRAMPIQRRRQPHPHYSGNAAIPVLTLWKIPSIPGRYHTRVVFLIHNLTSGADALAGVGLRRVGFPHGKPRYSRPRRRLWLPCSPS